MPLLWGIDLGGTKIEAVVLDSHQPTKPISRERIDTKAAQGYDHIMARVCELLRRTEDVVGARASVVGLSHPGAINPHTGKIKNSNTVCLNGRALQHDLETALNIPVLAANDANCFALAEAMLGAARGYTTVFGVILGTGVGGGLVVEGKVLPGRHGIAGEWGHNQLTVDGPPCYCGRRGCVETVISGPALEAFYEGRSGKKLSLPEIVMHQTSDADAQATMDHLLINFARAMATVINIFDPHCIVLGGGVSNVEELYQRDKVRIDDYVFNDRLETPIVRNNLGDSAGVFGAAFLTEKHCGSLNQTPVVR